MSQAERLRAPGTPEVLAQIRELLGNILGEDYLEAIPIDMETSFMGDLEMQSVEFVAFAEALHESYAGVDLVSWVSDMPAEDLPSLTVGQLAELIAWHLSGEPARTRGGANSEFCSSTPTIRTA